MAACLRRACVLENRVFPASFKIVQTRYVTTTSDTGRQEHLPTAPDAIPESPTTFDIEELNLPIRKERGPLTVLQTLSSTVRGDEFSPGYQFIDDKVLGPITHMNKMKLLAAKVSGRTAARSILKQYPECFNLGLAKPEIAAYRARKDKFEFETGIPALQERIQHRRVTDAISMYRQLQEEGIEINDNLKMDLLDLCCVYNNRDPTPLDPDLLLLERTQETYAIYRKVERTASNTWQKNGVAMEIFNSLEEKTSRAYASVIRGMCNHKDCWSAYELLLESRNSKVHFERVVFHDLLQSIEYYYKNRKTLKDKTSKSYELNTLAVSILVMMKQQNIQVNQRTFELALQFCYNSNIILRILNEARSCGIEPTPLMWKSVLRAIYAGVFLEERDLQPIDIMLEQFEEQKIQAKTPEDNGLFHTMATHSQTDYDVLMRIHNSFKDSQSSMFVDFCVQELYYFLLLKGAVITQDLDKIVKATNTYTPFKCNLTPRLAETILLLMLHQRKYEYLKEFWSDICSCRRFDNQVVGVMLELMQLPEVKEEDYSVFSDYAKVIFLRKAKQRNDRLSAQHLGDIINIHIRANKMEEAWKAFEFLERKAEYLESSPRQNVIEELFRISISAKEIKRSRACVHVMETFKMKNVAKYQEKLESAFEKDK